MMTLGVAALVGCLAMGQTAEPPKNSTSKTDRGLTAGQYSQLFDGLRKNCIPCHFQGDSKGGLSLESPDSMRKGGDRGPAIVPGKAIASLMFRLASGSEKPFMPPRKNPVGATRLSTEELRLLEQWIDRGALNQTSAAADEPWKSPPKNWRPIYSLATFGEGRIAAVGRGEELHLVEWATKRTVSRLGPDSRLDPLARLDPVGQPQPPKKADQVTASPIHKDAVHAAAFSANGDRLATGGYRAIKVWKRTPPGAITPLQGDKVVLSTAAFSPDFRLAAAGDRENRLLVWETQTGKRRPPFIGHTAAVTSVAFHPNGEVIASASSDRTVRLWKVADGGLLARMEMTSPVNAVCWLDGGKYLALAPEGRTVPVWEDLLAPAKPMAGNQKVAHQAASRDGKRAAVLTEVGELIRLDETGRVVGSSPAHAQRGLSVSWNGDGTRLLTSGLEDGVGSVRYWDDAGKQLADWTFFGPSPPMALNPYAPRAAMACDGGINVYRLDAPPQRSLVALNRPHRAALTNDQRLMASTTFVQNKSQIEIRDLSSGAVVRTIAAGDSLVTSLAWSTNSDKIIAGSADGAVHIWSIPNGLLLMTLQNSSAKKSTVSAVAFFDSGRRAVFADLQGSATVVWIEDPKSAKPKTLACTLDGSAADIAPLPENRGFLAATAKQLMLFDGGNAKAGRTIALTSPARVTVVAPSGKLAAVATADGKLHFVDVASFAITKSTALSGVARHLAFSASGERMVVGIDKAVEIHDPQTGRRLEYIRIPSTIAAAFHQGVDTLLSIEPSEVRFLPLRFEKWFAAPGGEIRKLHYSADSAVCFAVRDGGVLDAFRMNDGGKAFNFSIAPKLNDFSVSHNNQWLAAVGEDRTVRVHHANNGTHKNTFGPFPQALTALAFSADSRYLFVAGERGLVRQFDLQEMKLVQSIERAGLPTPRAQQFAVLGEGGKILLSTGADGSAALSSIAPTSTVSLSLNTRWLAADPKHTDRLAAAGDEGSVSYWQWRDSKYISSFGLGGRIHSATTTPDNAWVAAVNNQRQLRFWKAENGQQIVDRASNQAAQREREISNARVRVVREERDALKQAAEESVASQKAETEEMKKAVAASPEAVKVLAAKRKILLDRTAETEKQTKAEKELAKRFEAAVEKRKSALLKKKMAQSKPAAERETADQQARQAEDAVRELEQSKKQSMDARRDVDARHAQAKEEVLEATVATDNADRRVRSAKVTLLRAETIVKETQSILKTAEQTILTAEAAAKAAESAVQKASVEMMVTASSPDSRSIAVSTQDNRVLFFAAHSGRELGSVETSAKVIAMAYNSDGLLGAIAEDGSVRFIQPTPEWTLERHMEATPGSNSPPIDRVASLAFSPKSNLLASGGGLASQVGEIVLWDVSTGAARTQWKSAHTDIVYDLAFDSSGDRLATAGADRFAKVFAPADGRLLWSIEGHTHHVLSLSWSPTGRYLYSGGADNSLRVWEWRTRQNKQTFSDFPEQLSRVCRLGFRDQSAAAVGRKVFLLDRDGNRFRELEARTGDFLFSLAASDDGRTLFAGGQLGVLYVWDVESGERLAELEPAP